MHQVFSALKYKELKAMAPECVRNISIDDLQELCTEELLGISSKRLCAILDGAEPPSDTESSSHSPSPPLETISLDSISSDDEILSETSKSSKKNKKHKHKHAKDKSKKKDKRKSDDSQPDEEVERSKATRAGLTVLELLELQARARAIRAQLQKEQPAKQTSGSVHPNNVHSSDNEVEIKEEPAEVVEISSEDEKPSVKELEKETQKTQETEKSQQQQTSVTKRINDLIITIPQSKQTRKIKLSRNQTPANAGNTITTVNTGTLNDKSVESNKNVNNTNKATVNNKPEHKESGNKAKSNVGSTTKNDTTVVNNVTNVDKISDKPTIVTNTKTKANKTKIKRKKKEKKINIEEDHDEITIQLSDTEKMDLLEDLDRKNFDDVSSSSTEDSESSSDTSEEENSSLEVVNSDKKDNNYNEQVETRANREKDTIVNKDAKDTKSDASNYIIIDISTEDEITDKSKKESKSFEAKENDPETSNTTYSTMNTENSDQMIKSNTVEAEVQTIDSNVYKELNTNKLTDTYDTKDIKQTDISKESSTIEHLEHGFSEAEKQSSNTTNIDNNKEGREDKFNAETEKIKDFNTNLGKTSTIGEVISIMEVKHSNTEDYIQYVETSKTKNDNNTKEAMDCVNTNNANVTDKDASNNTENTKTDTDKKLSDGELSDNENSEIEVTNLKPEVVCISDEEVNKKKKKKKDKKNKKSKKKSDFREGSDQNFFKDKTIDAECTPTTDNNKSMNEVEILNIDNDNTDNKEQTKHGTTSETIDNDSASSIGDKYSKENIYIIVEDEILILSDDSSCYEVDTYLSKEPTAEEIEALSLKIDEIDRDKIICEKEIKEHERQLREKETSDFCDKTVDIIDILEVKDYERDGNTGNREKENETEDIYTIEEENVSWKERYLGSKKVKTVLSTANIFNALRKKNIELKKKLEDKRKEETKKLEEETKKLEEEKVIENKEDLEVGSVEHYNTLQGSTKYIDPVKDIKERETEEKNEGVTHEMKKDAKQLLKMYKKLLKYNDMNRIKDPNKKRKKKKNKDN
ncbi:hypothetical protein K1T71_000566 [Dendrolimus kikuchii]|uniref:Uncharacterized protein n=1 Tax=Dendrolimus kikuchii TaxID=765133 RepID=A0ACC1DJL0_9NEOP|nr:hypothetical protein K1T71_000566 [Dendrolimus kikuchii]